MATVAKESAFMANKSCPVCNSIMNRGLQNWHWVCAECRYENAEFEPTINDELAHKQVDEEFREIGLRSLRIENFDHLLHAIIAKGYTSGDLLDVGCAHGWFLEAAQNRGFRAFGIEPDINVYEETIKRGLSVRQGFFPQTLRAGEQFDIIVFNDVFEHIPDMSAVLSGCLAHLRPGGILVLNLPSTSGFFYKLSRFMHRFGINGFFDRLWQKGYPSPHIHYFNPHNLRLLLCSNGFQEIAKGRLSTLRIRGLYARVSHTGSYSLPVAVMISFLIILAIPILRVMPSDIIYGIFRKPKFTDKTSSANEHRHI